MTQIFNKKGAFLYDYENGDYSASNYKIRESSYIIKQGKNIQVTKSNIEQWDKKKNQIDYIGKISIQNDEEYFWNYKNFFKKNKFIKPYDYLDWIVIGKTKFSSNYSSSIDNLEYSYKLSEGDFIKIGKITFSIRKIKDLSNKKLEEIKRKNGFYSSNSYDDDYYSNNNSNSNMNSSKNINEDLVIYNKFDNNNYNNINSNNRFFQSENTRNEDRNKNSNLTHSVNNKLKSIYIKIKEINKKIKVKQFKCRVCLCEGSFEGVDPLINPCKCTGSVKYIHLNCFRKWITSKVNKKSHPSNNIYYYTFNKLECEICKSKIPEIVEYRGKFISLLDFEDIAPPYIILQTMYQYEETNKELSEYNAIFVISFKLKDYIIIGRSRDSDIRLNNVSISRNHSMINYSNGNFYIKDFGSKFGTLLLIQNDILFLPFKEISIQTRKCLLNFRLVRTFLGCFKCYRNKEYEKMSYEDNFNNNDKKVYLEILENFNNNIVDPVEKFNSISFSNSINENNSLNDDEENKEKNKEENIIIKDEKDEKIIHLQNNIENKHSNLRYTLENKYISKKEKNNINSDDNDSNNNNNTLIIKRRKTDKEPNKYLDMNIDGNIFNKKIKKTFIKDNRNNINKQIKKQNESNDSLIRGNNNNYEDNCSTINIMNILKRKNIYKRPASVLNIPFNKNANSSQLENKDNFLEVNTQRENYQITTRFYEIYNNFK